MKMIEVNQALNWILESSRAKDSHGEEVYDCLKTIETWLLGTVPDGYEYGGSLCGIYLSRAKHWDGHLSVYASKRGLIYSPHRGRMKHTYTLPPTYDMAGKKYKMNAGVGCHEHHRYLSVQNMLYMAGHIKQFLCDLAEAMGRDNDRDRHCMIDIQNVVDAIQCG